MSHFRRFVSVVPVYIDNIQIPMEQEFQLDFAKGRVWGDSIAMVWNTVCNYWDHDILINPSWEPIKIGNAILHLIKPPSSDSVPFNYDTYM